MKGHRSVLFGGLLVLSLICCQQSPQLGSKELSPTSTLLGESVPLTNTPVIPTATQTIPTFTSSPTASRTATATSTPTSTPTRVPPPPPIVKPGQVWISSIDGAEMVGVPAGEFTMGRVVEDIPREGPPHIVYLDAFYIDKYEVTNAQYRMCIEASGCIKLNKTNYFDDPDLANHPVVNVTIDWARRYCRWAGKRLPTEAEWEKAARGTDERTYPWGEEIDCAHAQYKDCGGQTVPIGSFPAGASPYGAQDMAGNVWEWTSDHFQEDYYQVSPERNPTGGTRGNEWVFRGGSWSEPDYLLRTTYRTWYNPDAQYYNLGFRCVKTLN